MALINWLLGIFFVVGGLSSVNTSLTFSLLYFFIAVLLIPPLYRLFLNKTNLNISNKLRYIVVIALFFISPGFYPQQKVNLNTPSKVDSQETITTPAQINTSEIVATITPSDTPVPTRAPTSTPKPTAIIYPTWTPIPTQQVQTQVAPPVSNGSAFSCNCGKTCKQIASCEEAYYQLNNCGCSIRDGDHDGVPCENLCR